MHLAALAIFLVNFTFQEQICLCELQGAVRALSSRGRRGRQLDWQGSLSDFPLPWSSAFFYQMEQLHVRYCFVSELIEKLEKGYTCS